MTPKVRPLTWVWIGQDTHQAETAIGWYQTTKIDGKWFFIDHIAYGDFPTEIDAMNSAFQQHEEKILSELEVCQ